MAKKKTPPKTKIPKAKTNAPKMTAKKVKMGKYTPC